MIRLSWQLCTQLPGLTRQREFTQAEIEYFVNPKNKAGRKVAARSSRVYEGPESAALATL